MSWSVTSLGSFTMRIFINVALALHLIVAVAYWWLSPKGFPINHSRFWLNSVLPIVLSAVAAIGIVAMHRNKWSISPAVVLFFATGWCVGAIYSLIEFPTSLKT